MVEAVEADYESTEDELEPSLHEDETEVELVQVFDQAEAEEAVEVYQNGGHCGASELKH